MTPEIKFNSCTEDGCSGVLSSIHGLDDNITIGQLRNFLQIRTNKAKQEKINASKVLISNLVNKCFRIKFSDKHTVLLKISDIEFDFAYGGVDAIIIGEQLTKYDGQLSFSILSKKANKKYSNFGDVDEWEVFEISEFNLIKSTFNLLNF